MHISKWIINDVIIIHSCGSRLGGGQGELFTQLPKHLWQPTQCARHRAPGFHRFVREWSGSYG